MTDIAATAAAEERQEQQQPQQNAFISMASRMAIMYFAMQYFNGSKRNAVHQHGNAPTSPQQQDSDGAAVPYDALEKKGDVSNHRPKPSRKSSAECLWKQGSALQLHLFVTDSMDFTARPPPTGKNGHKIKASKKSNVLGSWHEKDIIFGQELSRNISISVPVDQRMANNETSMYAHVYLSLDEGQHNDKHNGVSMEDQEQVLHRTVNLTKFKLRKKASLARNLLGDDADNADGTNGSADLPEDLSVLGQAAKNTTNDVVLAYLKPSLNLELVNYFTKFPDQNHIPQQVKQHMDFLKDTYYPILYPSEFWLTSKDLIPVNGTLESITIDVTLSSASMWKWQLMSGMEQQWRTQEETTGDDGESDIIRTVLLDTNPWLLAITAIVSVLHTVMDVLAFKNDIKFFKGRKSMEGISVRSMVVNTFFQVVIFFYLMDNDTSWQVLMSNGVGLVIEFWKISKAISFSFEEGKFSWTANETYAKSKTKEYDEIATQHLMFVTMPLVSGYAIYSLFHMKHKSWYSWVLNTMVGFIYMFGFVMMTPQLFINYKLKSVAHLNWRTMTYKSINTFIDDLFAFVIKMPLMHRLACLRDDTIFFIFLYQKRKYRTDYTRVNEYGQCAQPTEEMMLQEAADANATVEAPVAAQTTAIETTVRTRRGARDR